MTAEIKLWEILVPTVRNDGRAIRLRFHRVWDNKVRAISGGLTILPVNIGQWVSPEGQLYKERMIPVRIACTQEEMAVIADETAKHYEQLAVMYYLVSEKVVIKHYPHKRV